MAVYEDRENFIPITKHELVDMLSKDPLCASEHDREKFLSFCKVLEALFHFEYHENLEELKKAYAPFNPDSDTVAQREYTPEELRELQLRLYEAFGNACEGANFEKMADEELNGAFEGWSPFSGLDLKVDLDHYAHYGIYYRGKVKETRERFSPMNLLKGKIKVPFEAEIYKRLAIMAQIKDRGKKTKKWDTNNIILKVFKNVPALDLEMLFPTTKPALKKLDLLQIVLPIILGIAMLSWTLVNGYLNGVEAPDLVVKGWDVTMSHGASAIILSDGDEPHKLPEGLDGIEHIQVEEVTIEDEQEMRVIYDGDEMPPAVEEQLKKLAPDDAKWQEAIGLIADDSRNNIADEIREGNIFMVRKGTPAEPEETLSAVRDSYGSTASPRKAIPKDVTFRRKNHFGWAVSYGLLAGSVVGLLTLVGSWLFKSVMKWLKAKQKYMGAMSQNLYYLNLDNNAGVFGYLIDQAEEEECKEAIFAIFFLNQVKDQKFNEESLDDYIEKWIEANTGLHVDFEIDDALGKLERLKLLTKHPDGTLQALPWDDACERLDYIWDNFFQFNESGAGPNTLADEALHRDEIAVK